MFIVGRRRSALLTIKEREKTMSGEKRVLKRKNRFHRWIAVALVFLLVSGQSHIPAFALEEPIPVKTGDLVEEKIEVNDGTGGEESGNTVNTDGENQGYENNNAGTSEDENNDGIDNENIENSTAEESGINGEDEVEPSDGEQDQCICETKCTAEDVNENCAICLADYAACVSIVEKVGGGGKPTF